MPGSQNIAEALSRLISEFNQSDTDKRHHAEEYIQFIAKEATPKSISTREVEEASKYDRKLSDVRDSLSQAKWYQSLTVNNYFPIGSELSRI